MTVERGLHALFGPVLAGNLQRGHRPIRPIKFSVNVPVWELLSSDFAGLLNEPLSSRDDAVVKRLGFGDQRWREAVRGSGERETTYVVNANALDPAVAQWLSALARDLGALVARGSVFASDAGAQMPPHFDDIDNFTIQLRGSKEWVVSAEPAVEEPIDNHGGNEEVSGQLAQYVSRPPRWRDIEDATTFVLNPGDVLYVPPGHWHTTRTIEESLSVSLAYGRETWMDGVLGAVRRGLVRDPLWRSAVSSSSEERAARFTDLMQLMGRLREEDFEPQPLVRHEVRSGNLLRRRPFAHVRIIDDLDETAVHFEVSDRGLIERVLEGVGDLTTISRLVSIAESMRPGEVVQAASIVHSDISGYSDLSDLVAFGVLEVANPSLRDYQVPGIPQRMYGNVSEPSVGEPLD
jgi:hypothetical protein